MPRSFTRRRFLQSAGAAAAAFTILPAGSARTYAANAKLGIAVVGSGIGMHNTRELARFGETIAAVCDVDRRYLEDRWRDFPDAKRYVDFRKMLEKEKLDGVVVATPDHTHAVISVMAMRLGIHCFCQKPLTRDVHEARVMTRVAKETGVITQMGTQTSTSGSLPRMRALVRSGVIGDVTEVHVWTNRPIWVQGAKRPDGEDPVPETLDWDLWLGPAPKRPYRGRWPADDPARKLASYKHDQVYHPFVWRGWWDFGTGALGDIAPHAMNEIFYALDLGAPKSVEVVETSGMKEEMFPEWSVLRYDFPGQGEQSTLKLFWYDGGKLPPEAIRGSGPVYIGTKGSLPAGRGPFRGTKTDPYPEPGNLEWDREDVHTDWTRGIRTGKQPGCHFGYSGPFTEAYLLGNIALRTGERVEWDGEAGRITNSKEANQYLRREYRKGWEL